MGIDSGLFEFDKEAGHDPAPDLPFHGLHIIFLDYGGDLLIPRRLTVFPGFGSSVVYLVNRIPHDSLIAAIDAN